MSENNADLYVALSKAQAEMGGAKKDSINPFFKSKYADLESVWGACRGPLTKHGLSVIQTTKVSPEGVLCVITTLAHSSGQSVSGEFPLIGHKLDPQGIGSAVSYARRYALAAIVGVYQTDDDGNSATHGKIVGDEPLPEDGCIPNDYRIPFGKFKNKSLEEVGPEALKAYVNFLDEQAIKKEKPLEGSVKDFVDRAVSYVITLEKGGKD